MPVEKILRAYIDETVDEEVIEETIEKEVTELEKKKMEEEMTESIKNEDKKEGITKSNDTVTLEKPQLEKAKIVANALADESSALADESSVEEPVKAASVSESKPSEHNIKLTIETPKADEPVKLNNDVVNKLSFNDTDSVVSYDTKASPSANPEPEKVEAPKTLERLEKIAYDQNEKRKAEEAEYDDEEDDDEKLQIFGEIDLKLDNMDVHNLDKKLNIEPSPILNDIEVLG